MKKLNEKAKNEKMKKLNAMNYGDRDILVVNELIWLKSISVSHLNCNPTLLVKSYVIENITGQFVR